MKKLIVLIVLTATYFVGSEQANAHAIWIESNTKATKNKSHKVDVFYGEYPEGQPDSVSKWYSDLKDLEVWIITPSQKKIKLDLKNVSTHLTASFIPAEDGTYHISTVHTTKELGGETKYEFSSLVPVVVGNGSAAVLTPTSPLAIISEAKSHLNNKKIELLVKTDGEILKKGEVLVMSPGGWVKTLYSDDEGKVSFIPQFKGRYVVEVSASKKEAGKWNDNDYTHTWKGSTTSFLVN